MRAYLKYFIFISALSGFSLAVEGASFGQIAGKIFEKESKSPIAFAIITFENKMDKMEVQSNGYGYYYADHLPTGRYQMRVVFNNRTFLMNQVRVFDGYTNEIEFMVSSSSLLPGLVEIERKEALISPYTSTNINLTNNTFNQPTRSLGEALSSQAGIDVVNGKLFVKGSDQVRFFIDGTPVMGKAIIERIW